MNIKIIKYYIVLILVFFSWVNFAHASLEITEIMYAPEMGADYEWVEIYNNGSKNEDLSNDLFFRGDKFASLNLKIGDNKILPPLHYAIIAKSMSDYSWLSFSGPIFSSSTLSLPDDSEKYETYIKIYNPLSTESDFITYDTSKGGSKTSKTSLSKINGEWTSATPTPGIANSSSTSSSDNSLDNSTDNLVDETVDPIPVNSKTPTIYKITTKIIAPKIVTSGVPFVIDHTTTGINKEKVILGKFIWNFGDGMKKEGSTSDPFEYIYDYPGEYVLSLSYADSPFDTKSDAVDRLTIKVIPSGVVISSVGTYADPFVEIENNSSYEMSLNKWILKGSVHSFVIPEGMVILPNKKLKLSPKITGFDFNDLSSISIIDQSGQTFATYPTKKTYSGNYYSSNNSQDNIVKADIVKGDQVAGIANSPDVINLNDLGANAVGAGSTGSANNVLNNKTLIYLGLAGIIIIGIVSVVLIRRKVDYPDYMEKEISAKDMTIME